MTRSVKINEYTFLRRPWNGLYELLKKLPLVFCCLILSQDFLFQGACISPLWTSKVMTFDRKSEEREVWLFIGSKMEVRLWERRFDQGTIITMGRQGKVAVNWRGPICTCEKGISWISKYEFIIRKGNKRLECEHRKGCEDNKLLNQTAFCTSI